MRRELRRPIITQAARRLRREATPSERALWEVVRGRRFRGWKFRRQHAVGGLIVDFYCESIRVAIEVDGTVHDTPDARRRDLERERALAEADVTVVRLRADEVMKDPLAALKWGLGL